MMSHDVQASRRIRLVAWAREKHGVDLEIIDRQAIALQLADADVFWIAEAYLNLPSEIHPERVMLNQPVSERLTYFERWQTKHIHPSRVKIARRRLVVTAAVAVIGICASVMARASGLQIVGTLALASLAVFAVLRQAHYRIGSLVYPWFNPSREDLAGWRLPDRGLAFVAPARRNGYAIYYKAARCCFDGRPGKSCRGMVFVGLSSLDDRAAKQDVQDPQPAEAARRTAGCDRDRKGHRFTVAGEGAGVGYPLKPNR